MTATVDPFLRAIELHENGGDTFTARTQPVPWPKAYGGDLLAQAAAAAMRTVDTDRVLHSMHGSFLRGAGVDAEVRYEVERLRDGRSYSARHVRGHTGADLLFVATCSFQAPEAGGGFPAPAPQGLPEPESLPSSAEALTGVAGAAAEYWSAGRSFDIRHVPGPVYLHVGGTGDGTGDGDRAAGQAVWIRAFSPLPSDPAVHRLALIYVCDYTMLEPVLRRLGRSWSDPGLMTASLDHSIWLHRDPWMDDWVLFVQHAESAQAGRGLGSGSFYSRDGSLIATALQEGVVRYAGS